MNDYGHLDDDRLTMDKKVTCKSKIDFINEVADDCVRNLSEKEKEHLIANPRAIDYHFSYGMYIRNNYIHSRDFSEVSFWVEPDDLSYEIIRMILSRLLPEYDYDNAFIEKLYDTEKFLQLRKEYKAVYGEYPVFLVEKYKAQVQIEPIPSETRVRFGAKPDKDKRMEIMERNRAVIFAAIDMLVHELEELVKQADTHDD